MNSKQGFLWGVLEIIEHKVNNDRNSPPIKFQHLIQSGKKLFTNVEAQQVIS